MDTKNTVASLNGLQPSRIGLTRQFEPAAVYDPAMADRGLGLRGWLRLFRLGIVLLQFLLKRRSARRESSRTNNRQPYHRLGKWLSDRFIQLGPTFIKFGQSLATRVDIVPIEASVEFQQLLDQVPPFPTEEAFEIIRRELGKSVEELFAAIDPAPIAAASLGQVYRATLRNNERVVVKVQRPNLAALVNRDVAVLKSLVRLGKRFGGVSHKADWEIVLDEFGAMTFEEMDYLQESVNAETFRENFRTWKEVFVPRIYPEFCARHVLTMEYVEGLKINDPEAMLRAGVVPHEVHRLLAKSYLKQLLDDAFFHADPHPGNLRVLNDGRLAFFDFGMMGRIPGDLRSKLVDCFFHIAGKDAMSLVIDLIGLGFLEADGPDDPQLQPLMKALVDHYLHIKLSQTEVNDLALDLADVMYKFPFRIPPHFTYILRAMMTLEGIGKLLEPGSNFFDTARPFAKTYLLKREARELGGLLVRKLVNGDTGKVDWQRTWKLAKMALKFYFSTSSASPEPASPSIAHSRTNSLPEKTRST